MATVAILISGQVRFPQYGYAYLENLLKTSKHHVDVFVSHWDDENIPTDVRQKPLIKSIRPTDSGLYKFKLAGMLEDLTLTNREMSLLRIKETLPGLIAHMAACTDHYNDLRNYDCIVKWRWDTVMHDTEAFDMSVDMAVKGNPYPGFVFISLKIDEGKVWTPDVVFFGKSDIMLSTFSPLIEKFIFLCEELQKDAVIFKRDFKISCHWLFPKLIQISLQSLDVNGRIAIALLRENILSTSIDNLLSSNELALMQRQWELERDRILAQNFPTLK